MARYRRYRRTIIRAPKKKWASNISAVNLTATNNNGAAYALQTLVENSTQVSSPTPVIVKTGNFKLQGDVNSNFSTAPGTASISLYIVYHPESVVISDAASAKNLIDCHPEWILAWKYLSNNLTLATAASGDSFTFSSRLKRNLNSGDSIMLICLASGENMINVQISGMCQFWTCAN